MKLIRNAILIILLIVTVAIISYQLLDSPLENEEQDNLDSKLKDKMDVSDNLSNLIIDEQKKLKQNEDTFQLLKKPLFEIGNINCEPEFKLDYPRLKVPIEEKRLSDVELNSKDIIEKKEKQVEDNNKLKAKEEISNKIFLSIKDGYVAIYEGDVLGNKKLLQVRKDIPLKSLSQEDVKKLQLGIEVKNKKELLSILEGFSSAKN